MLAKWLSDETAYGGVLTHTISLAKEIGKLSTIDFHVVSFGDRSETIHEYFATINFFLSCLFWQ
jgi:predicted metal-dependent enzyme (double-stranded beta helix superfamily)